MIRAFKIDFPSECFDGEGVESNDNQSDSPDLAYADELMTECVTASGASVHLRCFAHSLQLAIGDGLEACRCISAALGKCSKITSLLHTSAVFKVC